MVAPLVIRCINPECSKYEKVINKITEIESEAARDLMISDWKDAATEDDLCKLCGELGEPDAELMEKESVEDDEDLDDSDDSDGDYDDDLEFEDDDDDIDLED